MTNRRKPRLAAWIGGAAAIAFLAACGGDLTDAEYLARAQARLDAQDINGALIEARNAARVNPDNPTARIFLGDMAVRVGDFATAAKEYERAIDLGVDAPELKLNLALSQLRAGLYEELIEDADRAIEAGVATADQLKVLKGGALLRLGRIDEARPLLREGVANEVSDNAYEELARLQIVETAYNLALETLDAAQARGSETAGLHILRGEALLRLSRAEEAAAAFDRAVEIGGELPAAMVGRARAALALSQFEQADEILRSIEAQYPGRSDVTLFRSVAKMELQRWEEAATLAERVLAAIEDEPTALYVAGVSSYFRNNFELANTRLARYLAIAPGNLAARKLLAAAKMQIGDQAGARAVLAEVGESLDDDPQLATLASAAALLAGEGGNAVRYLEQAVAQDPENTAIRARLAMTRLAAGDGEAGIAELERLIESDPSLNRLNLQLAFAHLRERRFGDAIKAAQTLQADFPDLAAGYMLEGAAQAFLGDIARASQLFERALEIAPESVAAAANYARILESQGELDRAREVLEASLETNPRSFVLFDRLAEIASRQNRPEEAIRWLEQAVAAAPANADAALKLAQRYIASRRPTDAIRFLEDQITLDPDNLQAIEMLGVAHRMSGNLAAAAEAYARLAELSPETEAVHIALAQIYFADGERLRAIEVVDRALDLNPEFRNARVLLARLAMGLDDRRVGEEIERLATEFGDVALIADLRGERAAANGDLRDAATHYRRALTLEPNGPRAIRLSRLLRQMGDQNGAISTLEAFLEQSPNDAFALSEYGEMLIAVQRYEEAEDAFTRFLEVAPNNAAGMNNLAWVQLQRGDIASARRNAEAALAADPANPMIKDTLGDVRFAAGELEGARGMFEEAYEAAPDAPTIGFNLAKTMHAQGETAEAAELLRRILAENDEFLGRAEAEALLRRIE